MNTSCKLLDDSCKWKKSHLFHQNITHHRGITSFGKQEQLRWINSPVYYFIIPPIILESAITSEISHFIWSIVPHIADIFLIILFSSPKVASTPPRSLQWGQISKMNPQNKTLWYPQNSVAVLRAYCWEITPTSEFSKHQTYQKFILHLGCYGLHHWLTVSPWCISLWSAMTSKDVLGVRNKNHTLSDNFLNEKKSGILSRMNWLICFHWAIGSVNYWILPAMRQSTFINSGFNK